MKLFAKNLRVILSSKTRISEKGQSLAEMCLSMVVLVMIMSGVIDIGRAYFAYIALEDSAGEAALYMSVYPNCPYELSGGVPVANDGVNGGDCDPPNNAMWRAQRSGGSGGLVDWNNSDRVTFTVKCFNNADTTTGEMDCSADDPRPGDLVIVTIDYQFGLISPIIPDINGSPSFKLTGTSSQLIVAPRQ